MALDDYQVYPEVDNLISEIRQFDLFEHIVKALGEIPIGIVRADLGKVAQVTDVIAFAVLVDVVVSHLLAGKGRDFFERLEDGTTVLASSADVVDLTAARLFVKGVDEAGDIEGMDVVIAITSHFTGIRRFEIHHFYYARVNHRDIHSARGFNRDLVTIITQAGE